MTIRYDRKALRRIRAERGLSLDDLAKTSRLTDRTLSYIERGFSDPKATTLAKLAHALGVSVEVFFVRKDAAA